MAFRRPKSLSDFLVQARLKPNSDDDNQNGECRPCGRKRCQCCKIIILTGTMKAFSGAALRLRQNTDYTTEIVVYLISCSSCNRHAGGTTGQLNKRLNGHRAICLKDHKQQSIFHSADHDFLRLSHASVCCLEHNKERSDSTRKLRESQGRPGQNGTGGKMKTRDFSNDDAIYDLSYSNWMRILKSALFLDTLSQNRAKFSLLYKQLTFEAP